MLEKGMMVAVFNARKMQKEYQKSYVCFVAIKKAFDE